MSVLGAASVAALLIASPSATDAARVAADGGFLLGNAHRCGIQNERIVRAGQLIRDLIIASAEDAQEQDEATARFARFFIVSAFVDPAGGQPIASCEIVSNEFERLEQHRAVEDGPNTVAGGITSPRFGPGDGE
jgi:hypothetical protein